MAKVSYGFFCKVILTLGFTFSLGTVAFSRINADSVLHAAAISNENVNKADAFIDLAYYYADRDIAKTRLYAINALKISKKLKYPLGEGCGYFGLGMYYERIGQNDNAIACYYKSYAIFESLKNHENISIVCNTIGIFYKRQNKLQLALKFYFKSVEMNRIMEDWVSVAFSYNNIGNVYAELNEEDSALFYYNRALDLHKETKTEYLANALKVNLGIQYENRGDLDEALSLYQESLNSSIKEGNLKDEMVARTNLGYLYIARSEYEKAHDFLTQADRLGHDLGDLYWKITIYEGFVELEKARESYEQALEWSNKIMVIQDSVQNNNNKALIGKFHAQIELDQQQKQILILEQKEMLANQSKLKMYVIFALIFSLGVLIFYRQRLRQLKKIKTVESFNEQLVKKKAETETELADRNNELTTFALHLAKKNEFLSQIESKLKKNPVVSDSGRCMLNEVLVELNQCKVMGKETAFFQERLQEESGKFYKTIEKKYPGLTRNEKKLAALLRLGLETKEIAVLNHVGESAVKMSRHRLRKHLNLSSSTDLNLFFQNLEV